MLLNLLDTCITSEILSNQAANLFLSDKSIRPSPSTLTRDFFGIDVQPLVFFCMMFKMLISLTVTFAVIACKSKNVFLLSKS